MTPRRAPARRDEIAAIAQDVATRAVPELLIAGSVRNVVHVAAAADKNGRCLHKSRKDGTPRDAEDGESCHRCPNRLPGSQRGTRHPSMGCRRCRRSPPAPIGSGPRCRGATEEQDRLSDPHLTTAATDRPPPTPKETRLTERMGPPFSLLLPPRDQLGPMTTSREKRTGRH